MGKWLGKQKASNGETGYPALSLMTLAETGTRAPLGAVFGPGAEGETGQARDLLPLLDAAMLLLIDRGFDGGDFLAAVAATKAQFLVRLTSTRRLPVLRHLPDGSFTTDAVQAAPGTDPDRAGWQIAVETAQNLLTTARNITGPAGDLTGDIGRAVLAGLHGPRRPRVCAGKISPRSAAGTSTPTANPAQTSA